jgi:membrane protein
LNRIRAVLRDTGRAIWEAGVGFYHHDGFDRASALAFWILLAFIPFLLIFTGLFGLIVSLLGGPGQQELVDSVVNWLREVFPKLDVQVTQYVQSVVAEKGTLSLTGIPLFLLTSSALYGTLETALEHIFHPGRSRSIARSKLMILGFVSSLMLILLALAIAGMAVARLGGFGTAVADFLLNSRAGLVLLSMVVPAIVFVVMVRFFTLEHIPRRLLWAGGLVFGLLWLLARVLFSAYLGTIAPYHWVYGSFATIVVVLLWIYYSSVIFLYAAELVAFWRGSPERVSASH